MLGNAALLIEIYSLLRMLFRTEIKLQEGMRFPLQRKERDHQRSQIGYKKCCESMPNARWLHLMLATCMNLPH